MITIKKQDRNNLLVLTIISYGINAMLVKTYSIAIIVYNPFVFTVDLQFLLRRPRLIIIKAKQVIYSA